MCEMQFSVADLCGWVGGLRKLLASLINGQNRLKIKQARVAPRAKALGRRSEEL